MIERRAGLLAWMRLIGVHQKVQRREVARLAHDGLTLAQFDVLAQLTGHEGISQQELADRLLVTKGNVCGLMDRMSRQGLVERRDDPDDRRANRVYLTETGRALAARVLPTHEALLRDILSALSPDEAYQLNMLLRKLDRSLGSE